LARGTQIITKLQKHRWGRRLSIKSGRPAVGRAVRYPQRRPSAEELFTSRPDATIGLKLTEGERARRHDQQVH
jgi:hypothetical protein